MGSLVAPPALAQTDLTALEQALPPEAWAELQTLLKTQQYHADIVWTTVAGALVFFMQAGFAMVEAGFTRAKNATNIVLKNLMDFCFGACAFWFLGFGLMFGSHVAGFLGTNWFFFNWQQGAEAGSQNDAWPFTFFCFQLVFAATAATIVSGAMAERTRFLAYLIYSIVISGAIYPISGAGPGMACLPTTTVVQPAGWKTWATLTLPGRGWCTWWVGLQLLRELWCWVRAWASMVLMGSRGLFPGIAYPWACWGR